MATLEKILSRDYNLSDQMIFCITNILEKYKKEVEPVPDVITLKKYSEKAGIVTGLDYRKDKKLASLMKSLSILKWNPSLRGFIYPLSKHDTLVQVFESNKIPHSDLTEE